MRSAELVSVVDDRRVKALERIIAGLESVAVAFSGGADSTLLLAMCLRVLGAERVRAVTADSPTLPRRELEETRALAAELGAEHLLIPTAELEDERFVSNPVDRCYFCKQELFARLRQVARQKGYRHLVYGATAADLGDHRPGMRAAKEAGAVAPLLEAGFTKEDVRSLSRQLGLRTWDKPSMASLSSRFPYGTPITNEGLAQVEQAEDFLHGLGFRQVRVRHHGSIARIEVLPEDLPRLLEETTRQQVVAQLKALGYPYVALDLAGFRSGSMNEIWRGDRNDVQSVS